MDDADTIINVSELDPDQIKSDILRHIFEKCQAWRTEGSLLLRSQLSPQELSHCLPHIALVNYFAGKEKAFQISLAGEEIINRKLGYQVGAYINDVMPEYYSRSLLTYYSRAVHEAKMKVELVVWDFMGHVLPLERILIPMASEENGPVKTLLVATHRGDKTLSYMKKKRDFEIDEAKKEF